MPPKKLTSYGYTRSERRGTGKLKKVMKKVSKKGAYKKSVKNQMALRRAPIVETLQRVHSDIAQINGFPVAEFNTPGQIRNQNPATWQHLPVDDAFTFLPIDSFYRNSHGFEEYNCKGNSIFSKFINCRVQLRFPHNEKIYLPLPAVEQGAPGAEYQADNHMIQNPTKVYLICGWVTQNWNCPIEGATNATPLAGSRPARDQATQDELHAYIKRQLKPYFDDSTDKLMFREKETSNIKIDKYVQFKPNLDNAVATQAVPLTEAVTVSDEGGGSPVTHRYQMPAHGSIPDVMRSWSVKTNRKIHLTLGTAINPEGGDHAPADVQNLYPNHTWLPWMVIYNPSWNQQAQRWTHSEVPGETDRFSDVVAMNYRYNDCHYMTDS